MMKHICGTSTFISVYIGFKYTFKREHGGEQMGK